METCQVPVFASRSEEKGITSASSDGSNDRWAFKFFDCLAPLRTSCLGFWCPCVLFGKTYAREHGEPDPNGCGMMCCAWYCAASLGFHSCFQCIFRGQTRKRYGIQGNALTDFAGVFCCACCALVQEEKESLVRKTGIDPKTNAQYVPVGQDMRYPTAAPTFNF